jgi:hypothetical protein
VILRSRLSVEEDLEANRRFQEYQQEFAVAWSLAQALLNRLTRRP